MSKKLKGLAALSIVSAMFGGGILASEYLYRITCVPRRKSDEDRDPRTMSGRRFVRNNHMKQDIYINSIDNTRLHASFIPCSDDSSDYAIAVHGVWDEGDSLGDIAKNYLNRHMNVLLPDLRGHGESGGKYIGYGYDDRLDIVEWIYWILKRDKNARIILHGVSMGAATVLMTTGEQLPPNVKLCIADSSYSTAPAEFEDVYESQVGTAIIPRPVAMIMLRLAVLIRAGYDIRKAAPIDAVRKSKTPTLFLHGDADKFIDPRMCAELYEAAACPKRYALILGADHVEGGYIDPARYWGKIDAFIKEFM